MVREGDFVCEEVNVANVISITICNEGEGGAGGDVNTVRVSKTFVGARDSVRVGVDAFDGASGAVINDEEKGIVGTYHHIFCSPN